MGCGPCERVRVAGQTLKIDVWGRIAVADNGPVSGGSVPFRAPMVSLRLDLSRVWIPDASGRNRQSVRGTAGDISERPYYSMNTNDRHEHTSFQGKDQGQPIARCQEEQADVSTSQYQRQDPGWSDFLQLLIATIEVPVLI